MTESADELIIRPAQAADKAAVLAFTQQTWSWGDYIADVWDAWLAYPGGGLIVGEAGGAVVVVDMLRQPRPGEGWLSGLRVHPAYRGRGIGRLFMEYQIGAARARNCHTLRFLTLETNTPIHKNAARYGFTPQGRFLVHHADRDNAETQAALAAVPASALHPLATAAEAAWSSREAGPLWAASAGCLGTDHRFARFSQAWWEELVAAGQVWAGAAGGWVIFDAFDPHPPTTDSHWLAWADPGAADLTPLIGAATRQAFTSGYPRIETIWPRTPEIAAALAQAGWEAEADSETMLLFELAL